jgi:hypothetical protein
MVYKNEPAILASTDTLDKRGRSFRTRFKEHEQDYRHKSGKSVNAKHLLDYNHPLQSIDNSMHILHTTEKRRLLNMIENFYVHSETIANNQLTDRMTAKSNILFDVIVRHTQPLDVILSPRPTPYKPLQYILRYRPPATHTHHITQHKTTDTNSPVHRLPR